MDRGAISKGRAAAWAAVMATAVVAALAAPRGGVLAQSPFPTRTGVVANGTDMAVSVARLNSEFEERIGGPYGLEGVIVIVDDCRPDPEVYLDQALVSYGLAPRAGAMYDDTVAWLVCLEPRYTGFFYPTQSPYAGQLDSDSASEVMVDALREGNFTGAFTASFDEVVGQLAGSASSGTAAGQPVPSEVETAPGGGRLAKTALVVAAVLAAGGGAVWWMRRRGSAEEPEAAPRGMSAVRDFDARLEKLKERLTAESTAVSTLVLAYESLGDDVMLDVHRRHQTMVERLAVLTSRAEQMRSEIAADDLTGDEIEARLKGPRDELEALESYVDEVEREAEHVQMLEERAPVLLVEAREAIEAAAGAYAIGAGDVELPPPEKLLRAAETLADKGEESLTAGQRVTAGRQAEGAKAAADAVAAVPGLVRDADRRIDEAALRFPRLESYAESSWADIRGNGSEAEESLDAVSAMLQRIAEADLEEYGTDLAAGFLASLARAREEIDRADGLAAAVLERLEFLDRAKGQAGESLAAVQAEIDEAKAWIERPDVDPDVDAAPVMQLAEAEARLQEARLAMGGPTPDWIKVLRAVNEADRSGDAALALAQSQHEETEALRRQAEAAATDAEASVHRAESYLTAHRPDVQADAPSQVASAREAMAMAVDRVDAAAAAEDVGRRQTLRSAVEAYGEARRLGDAAYEAMAAAVARAERERQQYVPRPTWMGPVVPVPRRAGPIFIDLGGSGGGGGYPPRRRSSWGSRPSGRPSGGRSSSSRRGGGRGW